MSWLNLIWLAITLAAGCGQVIVACFAFSNMSAWLQAGGWIAICRPAAALAALYFCWILAYAGLAGLAASVPSR